MGRARGLAYVLVGGDGALDERGPVIKNLSEAEPDGLVKAVGAGIDAATPSAG